MVLDSKRAGALFSRWLNGQLVIYPGGAPGTEYFVDANLGDDDNSGLHWDAPKATIQAAITLANASLDWSIVGGGRPYPTIWIAPGLYAEALTPPYYTHVVGLGVLGTDTAVEVHPAAGAALTGTLLGSSWENMRFETETAVPVIDIGIGNNSIIEDCEIVKGIAGLATVGIDVQTATHLFIRRNRIISGVAAFASGINFDHTPLATADKFVHACEITDNLILASTVGVRIDEHNVSSACLIARNIISRPTKGIDENNGNALCVENKISASSDAIEHANSATLCINNSVINNVTGAKEASGT